jgi:hypothetical protein
MKFAFVVRLGTESRPEEGFFEGWVEEVDSCTGQKFHSSAELLSFLGQCFEKASSPIAESDGGDRKARPQKKNCH